MMKNKTENKTQMYMFLFSKETVVIINYSAKHFFYFEGQKKPISSDQAGY